MDDKPGDKKNKLTTLSIIFILIIVILLLIISYCILTLFMCSYNEEKLKDIELENLPPENIENQITIVTLGTQMKKELYNNVSSLKQYEHNYKVIGIGKKF